MRKDEENGRFDRAGVPTGSEVETADRGDQETDVSGAEDSGDEYREGKLEDGI